MLFKHFMCTVYQTFYDECLKNVSSKTLISSAILCFKNISSQTKLLELFYKHLINVFSKNVCIENVYKTFFKHYSTGVYLETFRKPKIGFN